MKNGAVSYFEQNADQIRKWAKQAEGSPQKFWSLTRLPNGRQWPDFQSVIAANTALSLGLDVPEAVVAPDWVKPPPKKGEKS